MPDLAEKLRALALRIERREVYPDTAGRRLRELADRVERLQNKRTAHLHGIAHGQSPYVAGPDEPFPGDSE